MTHQCPHCAARFHRQTSLTNHLRSHAPKAPCTTEGCTRPVAAKGVCNTCWARQRRVTHPEAVRHRERLRRRRQRAAKAQPLAAPPVPMVPPHRWTLGSVWLPEAPGRAVVARSEARESSGSPGTPGRASGAPRPSGEERRPWPTLPRADAWARTEQAGWGCAA